MRVSAASCYRSSSSSLPLMVTGSLVLDAVRMPSLGGVAEEIGAGGC
jgi:hypothetical protein